MCGVAGILSRSSCIEEVEQKRSLSAMIETIGHRGPDDQGIWACAKDGIALGHQRLAVLDLSSHGHQPMASSNGRFRVVYNGEIYNYLELRKELGELGYSFKGRSDTEVLLGGIQEWGLKITLSKLAGMFAFALWDSKKKELTLVRDRIGEKPLYYGWVNGDFAFGSELKPFRTMKGWKGDIDRNALASYFRFSYIPTPYSIYKDIYKLTPGSYLTIGNKSKKSSFLPSISKDNCNGWGPQKYWSLSSVYGKAETYKGSRGEALETLQQLLERSVSQKMLSDVPVGALLSGGIDSSLICAMMQQHSSESIKTFTIGFDNVEYDESYHARDVANYIGSDHTTLVVNPAEAQSVITKLPNMYDEPFSDSSQIPTYLVCKLARSKVTVALTGDGGDELFGGYDRYQVALRLISLASRVPNSMGLLTYYAYKYSPGFVKTLAVNMGQKFMPRQMSLSLNKEKLARILSLLKYSELKEIYAYLISHWKHPDSLVLGGYQYKNVLNKGCCDMQLDNAAEEMMCIDTHNYLPDDILTKVDRASMTVSLETRIPLLDHRIVEFAWGLPIEHKINGSVGKWILKELLYRYIPKEKVDRPKKGFAIPIGAWLKGPLREWAESLLDPARVQREGYLNPGMVATCWEEHISGRYDRQYYLWDILMFQAWLENNQ